MKLKLWRRRSKNRDWLLEDNEKIWKEEGDAAMKKWTDEYGPICEKCGWPVYHPMVQPPDHPGQPHGTKIPHDCFTGDPLAR